MASCRLCGQTIRFDKEFKSEYTGKLIPLDEKVDEAHNCPVAFNGRRLYTFLERDNAGSFLVFTNTAMTHQIVTL